MTNSTKHINILIVICFLLFISLPLITQTLNLFNFDYIQNIEKRNPNAKPSFPETMKQIKAYPKKMSDYLNDHFGFRSWLIIANNTIKYTLENSPSDAVIIGKDNWLYFTHGQIIPQYSGLMNFSQYELNFWISKMEERGAWLKSKNIPFYVVIPPNKITIYPEHLPEYIKKLPVLTRLEQLENLNSKFKNFSFLSLKSDMFKAKDQMPVYYQTDSHWNYHGAYIGYQKIMHVIKKDFPYLNVLDSNFVELSFEKTYNQDLGCMLNLVSPVADFNGDKFKLKEKSSVIQAISLNKSKRDPMVIHTNQKDKPVVIIFRDSYTIPMEHLFNESFKTIIYASYDRMRFDKTLIEKYKPDIVLNIMVERMLRYIPDNFCLNKSPSDIVIKDWGPRHVKIGTKVFKQPNGKSAMWIKAENITKDCEIIWEKHSLPTYVDVDNSLLTACIPDSLYSEVKNYEVTIKNNKTGKISNPAFVFVYQ